MPSPPTSSHRTGAPAQSGHAPLLEATGLRIAYGDLVAVWDVSVCAFPGTATAIVGRNGAGKTTLMWGLAGLLATTRGSVVVDGVDMTSWRVWDRAHAGLCLVPEGKRVFRDLTVEENLLLGMMRRQVPRGKRRERLHAIYDRFAILGDRRSQSAGVLSGGQQQLLAVASAVITEPKVLLVDEPSSGLSPLAVDQVLNALDDLKREGLAIVVVEQLVERVVSGIADRVVVIEQGVVTLEDAPDRIDLADLERRLSVA